MMKIECWCFANPPQKLILTLHNPYTLMTLTLESQQPLSGHHVNQSKEKGTLIKQAHEGIHTAKKIPIKTFIS